MNLLLNCKIYSGTLTKQMTWLNITKLIKHTCLLGVQVDAALRRSLEGDWADSAGDDLTASELSSPDCVGVGGSSSADDIIVLTICFHHQKNLYTRVAVAPNKSGTEKKSLLLSAYYLIFSE